MMNHHLDETTLLEYATGALAEPVAMLTATHLALCPSCRQTNRMLDLAGGALVENELSNEEQPAPVSATLRDAVFGQLDDEPAVESPDKPAPDLVLPRPLRDYLGCGMDGLEFRKLSTGLEVVDLLPDYPGYTTRLMRISAGKAMPLHGHTGTEYTLVLDGGFDDGASVYHRGDVAVADEDVEHQPTAERGSDCICLAVNGGPVRLTGPLGRFLNPFVQF